MKEVWKDIKDYERLYQVSNFGNIKTLKRTYKSGNRFSIFYRKISERLLKISVNNAGYCFVRLSNNNSKNYYLNHRIVAQAFIPNPEDKPHINHKNGIKTDNRVENLEWVTPLENAQHAIRNNLVNSKGENNKNSKLKEKDIIFIRKSKLNETELAEMFNVSQGHISHIIKKDTWNYNYL